MTCEEFKEEVWRRLDDNSAAVEGLSCPNDHAACRAYSDEARRLRGLLPAVFDASASSSLAPAILARIRSQGVTPEFSSRWIPAAVAGILGAYCALYEYFGPAAVEPFVPVPDLDWVAALPACWDGLAGAATLVPSAWLAPIAVLTAVLWTTTYRSVLQDASGGENGNG